MFRKAFIQVKGFCVILYLIEIRWILDSERTQLWFYLTQSLKISWLSVECVFLCIYMHMHVCAVQSSEDIIKTAVSFKRFHHLQSRWGSALCINHACHLSISPFPLNSQGMWITVCILPTHLVYTLSFLVFIAEGFFQLWVFDGAKWEYLWERIYS